MECPNCMIEVDLEECICPQCESNVYVIEMFKSHYNIWRNYINKYNDCLGYFHISSTIAKKIISKENFVFEEDTILFIRDLSRDNTFTDGLIITDKGITSIDIDKYYIFIEWVSTSNVYYSEKTIYFEGLGTEQVSSLGIECFLKDADVSLFDEIGEELAIFFNEIVNHLAFLRDPVMQFHHDSTTLLDQNLFEDLLDLCEKYCSQYDEWFFHYAKARSLYRLGRYEDIDINDLWERYYIKNEDEEGQDLVLMSKLSGDILLASDHYLRARYFYSFAYTKKKELNITDSHVSSPIDDDEINNKFYLSNNLLNENLDLIPFNERKIIMPIDIRIDIDTDLIDNKSILLVDYNNLHKLSFPIGHPILNEVYIGHPFLPNKYMLFENYDLELLEDKVREFCYIAQSLGATEIKIDCVNAQANHSKQSDNREYGLGANYKIMSGEGNYKSNIDRNVLDEISQSINLKQEFSPKDTVELPTDLVWYPNEPSWQRLYKQRIAGSLLSHEERIETHKNDLVNESELKEIEGSVKNILCGGIEGNYNKFSSKKFKSKENIILAIRVKFAPINTITSNTTEQISSDNNKNNVSKQISISEKEYLEVFQDCLEQSGGSEINSNESALLEKIRIRLGISESRSEELRQIAFSTILSEEEKEYQKEYLICLQDKTEVSHIERRLLNKLRVMLNISEDRVKELETVKRH